MEQMIRKMFFFICICFLLSCSDSSIESGIEQTKTEVVGTQFLSLNVERTGLAIGQACSRVSYSKDDKTFQFVNNDSLTVINLSLGKSYTMYYSLAKDIFEGNIEWNPDDELVAIYPCIKNNIIDDKISLEFNAELADKGCCWGIVKAEKSSNLLNASVDLYELTAKCNFCFKDNSDYAVPIKTVIFSVNAGGIYKSRIINLKTGQLEGGTLVNSLSLNTNDDEKWDKKISFNLFPSASILNCLVTDKKGNTYDGSTSMFRLSEGDSYNEIIKCDKMSEAQEYVEVCGVKWAMGNLQYDALIEGDKGFRKHYRIANNQYDYFGAIDKSYKDTISYDSCRIDRFNWGVVGDYVFDINKRGRINSGEIDISGKLFTDNLFMTNEINDFNLAKYGDLCYWASNGKYRLPTKEELYKLYYEASIKWGYIETPEGLHIRGALFTTPQGERIVDTKNKYNVITNEDLKHGLFLPAAGFRQAGDDVIKRAGNGFYWNSYAKYSDNGIYSLRYINLELYWSKDGPHYGRSMRPVLNENEKLEELDYIEVCGIKWAKGNLLYKKGLKDKNFIPNWGVSQKQWYFPNCDEGIVAETELCQNEIGLFNWGVVGAKALDNRYFAFFYGDISKKLFLDRNCTQPTDFSTAIYGDIAYWASNGNYRMPTKEELNKLFTEASYEFGYYKMPNGKVVNGYLFYNANGLKTINKKMQFVDKDMERGLFLPCVGVRNTKSSTINYSGLKGYYYDSYRDSEMNQSLLRSGDIDYRSTYAGAGRAIRPVLIKD